MDFDSVRRQFPSLREKTFLDAACVSLAPLAATDAIQYFLSRASSCPERSATLNHIAMDRMCGVARDEAARLIGAQIGEVALVESTSHGLSLVAQALPLAPGDAVLISDLEFLEVALPWQALRDRAGIEINLVPNCNGEVRVEDFAARITNRTRVIAISSVQWSNGYRVDLAGLTQICRERGIWLVVDAIQQLGAMPLDVGKTPVDFLACGGHKWLNAPFGCGFLYIRRERMSELRAPLPGYLSLQDPAGGWGNYFETPSITPLVDMPISSDARKFEVGGTANYPGAAGLAASLQLIHEIGQERIAQRIYELTDYLIAGLDRAGVRLVTPRASENRSGIVTFDLGSAAKNVAAMEHLLDARVMVSVRYTSGVGGVRVSCHFFNSQNDIERLLEELRKILR
ncbi:MAG: aminotransferase class V-fold PLP-dependent enzyme [Candidatus Acidiferrales bacterium]